MTPITMKRQSNPILPYIDKLAEETHQHHRIEECIWNMVAREETLYHETFHEKGIDTFAAVCRNAMAVVIAFIMIAILTTVVLPMIGIMDIKTTMKEEEERMTVSLVIVVAIRHQV